MRVLCMRGRLHQADNPLPDSHAIIGDDEERECRIGVLGPLDPDGRYEIAAIVGKELLPLAESPCIKQAGLVVEKGFDVAARIGARHARCYASSVSAPPTMRSHCAHQPRICASSVKSPRACSRSSSAAIPFEMSLHPPGA